MFEYGEFSDDSFVVNAKAHQKQDTLRLLKKHSRTYQRLREQKKCRIAKEKDIRSEQCKFYIKPPETADTVPTDKDTSCFFLRGGQGSFPVWVIDPWMIAADTDPFEIMEDPEASDGILEQKQTTIVEASVKDPEFRKIIAKLNSKNITIKNGDRHGQFIYQDNKWHKILEE